MKIKRDIVKSLTWKASSIIILIVISWFANVPLETIGKITVEYHLITFLLFIIHEKLWKKYKKYKKKKSSDELT